MREATHFMFREEKSVSSVVVFFMRREILLLNQHVLNSWCSDPPMMSLQHEDSKIYFIPLR